MANDLIILGLSETEMGAVIHALIEARDRVKEGQGNQYGSFTLGQLEDFVRELKAQQHIHDINKGYCPVCGVEIIFDSLAWVCPRGCHLSEYLQIILV